MAFEIKKPSKAWTCVVVTKHAMSLNYNHPDYATISQRKEDLDSDSLAALDALLAKAQGLLDGENGITSLVVLREKATYEDNDGVITDLTEDFTSEVDTLVAALEA